MNLDKLTLGQIKEIKSMFDGSGSSCSLTSSAIGEYVIVRSRNEGVNAGVLVAADETGCVLEDVRRLWWMKPKDPKQSWYEGVANSGVSDGSKLSAPVKKKFIVEDYSITLCSDEGEKSIKEAPVYEG